MIVPIIAPVKYKYNSYDCSDYCPLLSISITAMIVPIIAPC
jgi:hypothetical protein